MERYPAHPNVTCSVYQVGSNDDGTPQWGCRCMVCARCGEHTNNTTQGHYWKYCSKTGEVDHFHFCCPTLECE